VPGGKELLKYSWTFLKDGLNALLMKRQGHGKRLDAMLMRG
jgi:hypothetical protein